MENIPEASAIVIIVLFLIKEMFGFLKARKTNGNGLTQQVKLIGDNHLEHIQSAIEKQTDDNNDWHRKQYEILCQIAGKIK